MLKLTVWRDSLSHYYYSVFFGDWFIASLAFIGTFMIVYTGRKKWETHATSAVGIFTFGISLFPTEGSGIGKGEDFSRIFMHIKSIENTHLNQAMETAKPQNDTAVCLPDSAFCLADNVGIIHYGCAVVLFGFLMWYIWKVFLEIDDKRHKVNGEITDQKKARDRVYKFSIGIMAISSLSLLAKFFFGDGWPWWNKWNLTLWAEAASLWAFSLAWLTRSRIYSTRWVDDYQVQELRRLESSSPKPPSSTP